MPPPARRRHRNRRLGRPAACNATPRAAMAGAMARQLSSIFARFERDKCAFVSAVADAARVEGNAGGECAGWVPARLCTQPPVPMIDSEFLAATQPPSHPPTQSLPPHPPTLVALAALDAPRLLLPLLTDPSDTVAHTAAFALGRIAGHSRAVAASLSSAGVVTTLAARAEALDTQAAAPVTDAADAAAAEVACCFAADNNHALHGSEPPQGTLCTESSALMCRGWIAIRMQKVRGGVGGVSER